MSNRREGKLRNRLEAAERELEELLSARLPHTVANGDCLFFNSAFRPDYMQSHWLDPVSEELHSLSEDAVSLREQLGLPVPGSPGQLFLAACAEAVDLENPHRRGPRQLAAWLMGEVGKARD